ncbi:unnamed protein product, partial [Scytosiphon promiscuus]
HSLTSLHFPLPVPAATQVEDVTEAMRWISGNIGTLGFDSEPEVYIVGHSSGAHIALLYLIQQ